MDTLMKPKKAKIAAALVCCLLTLAFSVVLQKSGYLTYLNSDMASEVILAKRQADTHSLVQMDWLYSTEVHTIHMNLLYALAFLITPAYETARIIGNTVGFLLGMVSLVYLLRQLRVSWAGSLGAAALLPLAASALYAQNMTVGGYYIVHLPFAFVPLGFWLTSCQGGRSNKKKTLAFAVWCFAEGFLSVRYVLCFVCPMAVVAALEMMTHPQSACGLNGEDVCFGAVTGIGFAACLVGYAASVVVVPRLFMSGVGSASSFVFNPLDGKAMLETLTVVFTDALKLLGWRGGVPLFSAEGIINLCIAGVIFLGGVDDAQGVCVV